MKKVFDINIDGRKFVIDDDAYTLLSDYLDTLHHLFVHRFEGEEVVDDIESRVRELLSEKLLSRESQIVTSVDVTEIIERIGSPNELVSESIEEVVGTESESNADEIPPYNNESEDSNGKATENHSGEERRTDSGQRVINEDICIGNNLKRKLFRDPQDAMLGGVCSGIAAYMNTNPIWIRILAVILCFFSFSTVGILYLVLCIVVPEAKTPVDRLRMRGEQVTVRNIGDEVTGRCRPAEQYNGGDYRYAPDGECKPQQTSNGFTRFISTVIKVFLLCLMIIMSPVLIAVGIAFCVIAFVLIVGLIGSIANFTSLGWISDNWWLLNEYGFRGLLFGLSLTLMFGIPLFLFIWGAYVALTKRNRFKPKLLWSLLIVWILSVAGCFFTNKWQKMEKIMGDDRPMIEYFQDTDQDNQ